MIRILSVLILIAATLTIADASGFPNGTILDGYRYNSADGYWYWSDGTAYSRSQYSYYDSYGCLRYSWQYTRVYSAPVIQSPSKDPNWRDTLAKVALAREKAKARLLEQQHEQASFEASLKLLGLEGSYSSGGYATSSLYGTLGTTLYAHQALTIKDIWGDYNPSVGFQQLNQLAKAHQASAHDIFNAFAEVVGNDAVARARIAEILANRDAAVAFLNALKTNQSREVKYEWKIGPDGKPQAIPGKSDYKLDPVQFQKRVETQCAACHLGSSVKGGFDLNSLKDMSFKDRLEKVWGRLTHKDPAKRMPLAVGLSPGQPQTPAELREWYEYLFSVQQMPAAKE